MEILITVAVIGVLGLILGFLLNVASNVFTVKKDERIEKILEVLPGANCGACGNTGCSEYAEKISKNEIEINKCPVGGNVTVKALAKIMGIPTENLTQLRAQVLCSGTHDLTNIKYQYKGLNDCLSVARLGNGPKECQYGCIGLGSCVNVCRFGAISVVNGVAVVDYTKCKTCGMCADICPQHLIKLIPADADVWVGCMSKSKNNMTRQLCKVGCIGCGLCVKTCSYGAISVENNIAEINYEKCKNCGECVQACPRKIIWSGKKQQEHGSTITNLPENADEIIDKETRKHSVRPARSGKSGKTNEFNAVQSLFASKDKDEKKKEIHSDKE